MLNIRDNDGLCSGGSEASSGWVESSSARRLVASGASVDMYTADLDRPCGGGSWTASSRVSSSCVLPAPLGVSAGAEQNGAVFEKGGRHTSRR